MFKSARIQLTIWYLIIIMIISASFSGVIYREVVSEFEHFGRMQKMRILQQFYETGSFSRFVPGVSIVDTDSLVEELKSRVLLMLFITNLGILILSGVLGYVLAGITLRPIATMLEMQNQFISDASHELKTPLTILKTGLEVALRDTSMSLKDAKAIFKDNINEVDRLQKLSEGLLVLAREDVKHTPVYNEQVDLRSCVVAAKTLLLPLAKKNSIKILNKIKNISIHSNKQIIIDVLVILLDNAIKYSPKNAHITFDAKKIGTNIVITVTDTGYGISEKDLPHIFKRFYRADKARSGEVSYGLGLSIAQKQIQSLGGKITVSSIFNKGSTFTIHLPA